jgi:hypothetical protein
MMVLLVAITSAPQQPTPKSVAWLAGCWRMVSGSRVIDEMWMPEKGGVMLGVSRTVRADSMMSYEFLRIYGRSATLVYAANPSGQTPAEFIATLPVRDSVVFDNPSHDFPQRLVYRRVSSDSLNARVEGTIGGNRRTQSFAYRRRSCNP